MRRQDKYPDTSTFHFFNANPHNRFTTDCVARALTTATGIPYNNIVRALAEMQIKTGYDTSDPNCYGRWLVAEGWVKHQQPRKSDGKKFTGREFCKWLRENNQTGKVVAHIGGNHVVVIVDCKVCDTWDSTDGCIGNYWTR